MRSSTVCEAVAALLFVKLGSSTVCEAVGYPRRCIVCEAVTVVQYVKPCKLKAWGSLEACEQHACVIAKPSNGLDWTLTE